MIIYQAFIIYFVKASRLRYQNTKFFIYARIETESLYSYWSYCVQNLNNMNYTK
jgi:hypothetical protein